MLRPVILTLPLAAIAPFSAQAADNGFYLGAGYTQSEYGLDNPADAQPFDDSDSGYKLIAGWRPLDNFGVEVNYIDHGDGVVPAGVACIALFNTPCPDTTNVSAQTLSGFANLPVANVRRGDGVMKLFSGSQEDWNRIVAFLPGSHLLQTSEWAQVKKVYDWQPMPFVWYGHHSDGTPNEDNIIAAAMILRGNFICRGFDENRHLLLP